MLNCYVPRKVPGDRAHHSTSREASCAKSRDGNGKQSGGELPEDAIVSRQDGRGPYDMRQVVVLARVRNVKNICALLILTTRQHRYPLN